ncbi:MAG: DUF748 domain-containing protein [Candidatus Accumulibacter sp.]|jgi:hypothetical protein|nr:DUF748 domain-containing protein [Accumulibacter sp.]
MVFRSRFALVLLAGLVLSAGIFSGFRIALRSIGTKVQTLLGPQGQVEDIRIKLTGVEILGLKFGSPRTPGNAPSDWPDIDPLRVDRIFIEPSFSSFFFPGTVLRNVRIEGASLAVLRARDGRLKILPGMLDEARGKISSSEKSGEQKTRVPLTIEKIELVGSAVDFIDASIRGETHKVRIERINAVIGKVRFPERDGFTSVNLTGSVKGKRNDGKLTLTGSIELATLESGITASLRGVDLLVMTPYLLKNGDEGIDGGTLDIDVKSAIRQGKLHAPGTLTIDGLRVLPSSSRNAFLGVSLETVTSLLKDRLGKISLNFVVEGDIGEPGFSFGERLVIHIDSPMADYFGIRLSVPGKKPDEVKQREREAAKKLLKHLYEKSKQPRRKPHE